MHRHLKIIKCLRPALFVSLVLKTAAAEKEEKKPILSCASSGHKNKLKQSILAFRYLWFYVKMLNSKWKKTSKKIYLFPQTLFNYLSRSETQTHALPSLYGQVKFFNAIFDTFRFPTLDLLTPFGKDN
jgi:hypothetical protein